MPQERSLLVAYADSPYRGCCGLYGHDHPDGRCWDDAETHRLLVERLNRDFPDGWALSLKSDAQELREFIEWAGPGVRVGAWVKPFSIFKPGVGVAYAWEPVLFKGGRRRTREMPTVRDWTEDAPAVRENVTLRRGLTGAKPEAFCFWLFEVLGLHADDELADLFPGSGAVGRAWEKWRISLRCGHGTKMRREDGSCFACAPTGRASA